MAAFEWTGALLGLLGAFLLATHSAISRYGWWAFLFANFAMMAFAVAIDADGLRPCLDFADLDCRRSGLTDRLRSDDEPMAPD